MTEFHKSIPKQILVARRSSDMNVHGSLVSADKQHTKKFIETRDKIIKNSNMEPIIIDNTARTGFYIVSSCIVGVNPKYGVWQLSHPDGFIVNVSTDSFAELIENTTIINGQIQDELFFDNKMNLISENCPSYKLLFNADELNKDNRKTREDLKIGSKLQRIIKVADEEGDIENQEIDMVHELVYMGKYHFLRMHRNYGRFEMATRSRLLHVIYNKTKDLYTTEANMDNYIPLSTDTTISSYSKDVVVEILKTHFYKLRTANKPKVLHYYRYGNDYVVMNVCTKPIKMEDLKAEYIPIRKQVSLIDTYFPWIVGDDTCKFVLYDIQKNNMSISHYLRYETEAKGYKITDPEVFGIDKSSSVKVSSTKFITKQNIDNDDEIEIYQLNFIKK